MKILIYWFCETFGERDLCKTYQGYGNFEEERGWQLFNRYWISAERWLKKS
jgi:hypothetical protein